MASNAVSNYSEAKMQQVILYFLEHINNVHLGRTKLMKLLYFVDFDHYEEHGCSVTGAPYRKLPHGPYPDKIEKLIGKMEKAGLVREVKVNHKGYTQHRLITLQGKFDPAKFSGTELQTLERVAADWANSTATQIEAATHREAPWAGTEAGKKIDYEMAHYRHAIGFEPLDQSLSSSKKFAEYVAALA
ncbi:MAG: Panacea domain-containing protein [Verrucomicrobiota bacterium]